MATISEKSRTKEIIDRLQGIINSASAVPLAPGKISVYKDEVQSLLTELADQMDNELKTYHEVNDRRGKIISEAKKEAEKIIYQAERSASRMRVSRHTTGVEPLDYDTLNEEELSALKNADEIYGASLIYTDEMLTGVTEMISEAYNNIRSDYEIILQVLEEKLDTINNNRAELMEGLQEMDMADRGQQILEIGQLLSNELHMSRMRAKMEGDEYADGSVQMTLDLHTEQEEIARLAQEKAQQAEEALAQMTAERDALAAEVEQMRQEGGREDRNEKTASAGKEDRQRILTVGEDEDGGAASEEDVEYEIVYVTEDELEEGEEYEIEYVDDDEFDEELDGEFQAEIKEEPQATGVKESQTETEKEPQAEGAKEVQVETMRESQAETVKEPQAELENEPAPDMVSQPDNVKSDRRKPEEKSGKKEEKESKSGADEDTIPLIPHFKKSESVASVPSERIAKMAAAMTTDKKYSGLIGKAVKQKEEKQKKKDVTEAKMEFAEDYEIMEF